MPVTQQDIAKRLGVSQRLVSYALSGNTGVGVSMRQKIRDEATSMGYRPHRAAQALATGRTYQIAICFPRFLSSSFYSAIVREFELLARDTPYDLLVTTVDPSNEVAKDFQFAADGTIFIGPSGELTANIVPPVVIIQNQLRIIEAPVAKGIDRVQFNLEGASSEAVRHLIEQGCRRIAYVAHAAMLGEIEWRFYAYRQTLERAGLGAEIIELPTPDEHMIRQQAYQTLKSYFIKNGFPEAIFCCNDDIGMGAYRALVEQGKKIPDDVLVLSFDNQGYAEYLAPPMSSVHMPVASACFSAWNMLMERIEDPALAPRFQTFETQLVIRESSRYHPKIP